MQKSLTNPVDKSARLMADGVFAPEFGCWFYWWRSPLTVRSAGEKPA